MFFEVSARYFPVEFSALFRKYTQDADKSNMRAVDTD